MSRSRPREIPLAGHHCADEAGPPRKSKSARSIAHRRRTSSSSDAARDANTFQRKYLVHQIPTFLPHPGRIHSHKSWWVAAQLRVRGSRIPIVAECSKLHRKLSQVFATPSVLTQTGSPPRESECSRAAFSRTDHARGEVFS